MTLPKYLLAGLCLLAACTTEPQPPPRTLDPEKMAAILVEIHQAEATAQQAGFRSTDSTQLFYKYLEKKIFRRFRTDSTQYHDSYRWYVGQSKAMNEIYTAVVDTLAARQAATQAAKAPADTLKPDLKGTFRTRRLLGIPDPK